MKKVIRHYAVDTTALYLTSLLASGIVFERGLNTLLLTGIGLTLISVFAKPIINLLLLPINLVTFGLFRWLSSTVVLYIVTLIVSDFKIIKFVFHGFSNRWIDLPAISLSGILAFIAFSFVLSVISGIIRWLIK